MRRIDVENWPRRDHFNFFNAFDYPHFNMCANLDLTVFCPHLKQRDISFNTALVYVLARAANAVPEFRQRIRPGEVIEHDVVHLPPPSSLTMTCSASARCRILMISPISRQTPMTALPA